MAKPVFGTGVVRRLVRGWRRGTQDKRSRLLVIRHGMSPAFRFFCQIFATEHDCRIVEDRRTGERRHGQRIDAPERRRADFRHEDFWIIGGDKADAVSADRRESHFALP